MSIIGTNVAQSLAGLSQAERIEVQDKKPAPRAVAVRAKRKDEEDAFVSQTESDDAVRSLSSNEKEEARQDHKEHDAYPAAGDAEDAPRPSLDVEG